MVGCLVIHGYTGGPYEVEPLVTYLKQKTDWKIVVPTLPGHGEKLALENISHDKWIESAEENLLKLNAEHEQVYLIGFSMGGMIAAYLSAKYKVDKLVLLAPAGKYLSFKQISVEFGELLMDGLKGNLTNNLVYNHYRKKWKTVPFKSTFEFMKLVKHTRHFLTEIKIPVFIAQGQLDSLVPAKTIHYLDKKIASTEKEFVLFDRSKHMICLGDDKNTLNAMVHNFLLKKSVQKQLT